MKNSPRKTNKWYKGWTHSRIIEAMKSGGWSVHSFGYRVTTMRKGDRDIEVTWANYIDRLWPPAMWAEFLDRNGLTVNTLGDGVSSLAIVERQS